MNIRVRDFGFVDHTKPLFDLLASMPGIQPTDADFGFEYEADGEGRIESYAVRFMVEHSETGRRSLAFLSWLINGFMHDEGIALVLTGVAPNPFGPANDVVYEWQGNDGHEPHQAADTLRAMLFEYFANPLQP